MGLGRLGGLVGLGVSCPIAVGLGGFVAGGRWFVVRWL